METSRIGKNGTLVIPVKLRRRFGLNEGSLVILDATEDGVNLRPAMDEGTPLRLPAEV